MLTGIYTFISGVHPRQMLAVCVPFLTRLKAPRPYKYLYRYFYPGHLAILAVIYTVTIGPITYSTDSFYYEDETYYEADDYYYYDVNDLGYDDDVMNKDNKKTMDELPPSSI